MLPNFIFLSYAESMGPKLKALVEQQLKEDLIYDGINDNNLKFDWSDCCIEGHCTEYLDGSVENFSSIGVYNSKKQMVGDGWMDFIRDGDFFLCYWYDLKTYDKNGKVLKEKRLEENRIPNHIWDKIPERTKPSLEKWRLK